MAEAGALGMAITGCLCPGLTIPRMKTTLLQSAKEVPFPPPPFKEFYETMKVNTVENVNVKSANAALIW
ncbi:MAG: hypothetical protein ACE5IY_20075 [bacterium]